MNEEYVQLISLKYQSPCIKNLSNIELARITVKAITRIHVITGWSVPNDPEYVKILAEELIMKLTEDFSMLNFEEVFFAFRKNKTIKDWGKAMNLDLICTVLGAYCHEREQASTEERRVKEKPEKQLIYTDEEMTNKRRGEFEAAYQAMRNGYFPIIFDYYEELLTVDGIMEVGESLHEFLSKSLNNKIESFYTNK